jgi:hypothetical protein
VPSAENVSPHQGAFFLRVFTDHKGQPQSAPPE